MSTAIVLSGGGAKGSFQVGVLQKLLENGITPSAYYGTSVGALNSAGMAYMGIDALTSVWLSIGGISDVLKRHCLLTLPFRSGMHSMKPLKKKLDKLIAGDPVADATVCYVNMYDGTVGYAKNKEMSLEEFKRYVLASSSIPFAMEPVDGCLVDGGVREQAPLKRAIKDGYSKIIVIMCNPVVENPTESFKPSFPKLVSNGLRAIDVMEHEVMLNDIEKCEARNLDGTYKKIELKIYAPSETPMDTLDFDPEKIRKAIAMGRAAV